MKPRILIAMHYLEIGGAETALVGLLNAFDPKRVDVDLFLYDPRGEMMGFVPEWVNLLPAIPKYTVLERPIKELVKRGFWGIAVARLWAKCKSSKVYKKSGTTLENASIFDYVSKYTTPLLPPIQPSVEYDLAISFCLLHRIVLDKVKAKKKMAWIHTDYTRIWVDAEEELKAWSKYDFIASISADVTQTFLKVFPALADQIVEIENILSSDFVRQRADMEEVELAGEVTLLSIGRFVEAKNYENLPAIAKRVKEILECQKADCSEVQQMTSDGLENPVSQMVRSATPSFMWYIIGYGDMEALIRQKIQEAGMEDYVVILGKRSNPYPYIKACDLYVQPSRYEGKSVTVREAQILCKPVVVTNYPTASSQVKSGVDGVIVPLENEACAKGLAEVIQDKMLQNKLKAYLATHDYGNEGEVEKIYKIIEL